MSSIGFTGTQKGLTDAQSETLRALLVSYDFDKAHHGDCVGADAFFDGTCKELGVWRVIHPPEHSSKRAFCDGEEILEKKSYLSRNHDIVDAVDRMIGTPQGFKEEQRSGTWATLRYTRNQKKEMTIIFPDGSTAKGF